MRDDAEREEGRGEEEKGRDCARGKRWRERERETEGGRQQGERMANQRGIRAARVPARCSAAPQQVSKRHDGFRTCVFFPSAHYSFKSSSFFLPHLCLRGM